MELRQVHERMDLTAMQPEQMGELITVDTFDAWLRWLALVSLPIGIGVGLLWAWRSTRPRKWMLGALTGLLCGLALPLMYGMWRFYLWRIRIDLDRDFVGLHRMDVLLGNLLIFTLAGVAIGIIARLYVRWLQRQTS